MFHIIRSKTIQIYISLACTIVILVASLFNTPLESLFVRLDSLIYDQMMTFYPHAYKELARVVIIDIDDESLHKEGRWPWPRDKLALLMNKLKADGVVVVGVDIIMSAPEINYATGLNAKLESGSFQQDLKALKVDQQTFRNLLIRIVPEVDNDAALARAMKDYDVSLGFLFHNLNDVKIGTLPEPLTNAQGELLRPEDYNTQRFHGYNASLDLLIKASGHGGFVSTLADPDGMIRHGLVLGSINNKVYPSLALRTIMRYLLADHVDFKIKKSIFGNKLYGINVGGTFVPTNNRGQILIPFWGPQFTLPYYSATDVLHDKVAKSELEGAVAIIGSSAVMLGDLHSTPVAKLFPGVEMVGNQVAAMLGQQISIQYDWHSLEGIIIFLLIGSLFALLLPFLNITTMIIFTLALFLIILAISVFIFYWNNLFIPISALLVLIVLQTVINYSYKFFLEKRQKAQIKQLFGQYVPENYVQELIEAPDMNTMEGQTKELTVFFSDIRGFTHTSEKLDAAGVKRLLNDFFTPITEIIFNYQGTIDKYVGDMVVAFWGAPIPIPDQQHAYKAILSAINIFKELPSINAKLLSNALPQVNIGIGLGTGLMNVGDMGSKFRRAYTVLGDTVNLTSRLESLTKFYHVNILVNEETFANQDEFLWRLVDIVAVKGRKASLKIYEPLGLLVDFLPERVQEICDYHDALSKYHNKEWELASSLFAKLQKKYPDVFLYQLYVTRIQWYKKNPPPENWDGVYVHTEK